MTLIRIGEGPPPSFEDPIAVLVACHRRLEELLSALELAVAAMSAGRERALAAIDEVLEKLAAVGRRHSEDEDYSLFPRVSDETLAPLLDELYAEHRAIEAIQLALTAVRRDAGPDADLAVHAAALVAAYREHMRKEDAEVLPRARALDPAELRAIGLEMRIRRS